MAMEGLKSMSIDNAEMSLKSKMSVYGFCCTTASSGQSSEGRDQSAALALILCSVLVLLLYEYRAAAYNRCKWNEVNRLSITS